MQGLIKLVPGQIDASHPLLSVLFKQTYVLCHGTRASLSQDEQVPFYDADLFLEAKPGDVEIPLGESDLCAYKAHTDFIVRGSACVPRGRKATQLIVSAQLGKAKKSLVVFGNRKSYLTPMGFKFSTPEPFEKLPLHYGLAYGGRDSVSDKGVEYTYPKNPVGKGFIIKNNAKALHGLELPNIEHPWELLTPRNLVLGNYNHWIEAPTPASFSFLPKNFYPRYTYAGAGQNPEPRFFQSALTEFQLSAFAGNENVRLTHMDPVHPEFSFQMPIGIGTPEAWVDLGEGKVHTPMRCQTIEVLKDKNLMTLLWCGAIPYSGMAALEKVTNLEYGITKNTCQNTPEGNN